MNPTSIYITVLFACVVLGCISVFASVGSFGKISKFVIKGNFGRKRSLFERVILALGF